MICILDYKIEQYESTIGHLTRELQAARKEELPYRQIAEEISVVYPQIKHLCMGHGVCITIDSLKMSPCIIVKVGTDTLMNNSSLERFKNWMKVKLQVENIEIDNVEIGNAESDSVAIDEPDIYSLLKI